MSIPKLFKLTSKRAPRSVSTRTASGSDDQTGQSQLSSVPASSLTPHIAKHDRDGVSTTKIPDDQFKPTPKSMPIQKEVISGLSTTSERGPSNLPSNLAHAAAVVNHLPKESSGENGTMDKIIDGFTGDRVQTMSTVMSNTLELAGGAEAIKEHISTFVEHGEVLINVLDELARLHPFIEVAVIAFKTVWTLEMTRRENDQRILALYEEMRKMMAVLLELKNIGNSKQVDKGRLQEHSNEAAKEIEECASVCDAYAKTRTIIKVLNGSVWQRRLAKCGGKFAQRRDGFQYALTIHSAIGIDIANRKLEHVDDTMNTIDQKVEMIFVMFQKLTSPVELKLEETIDQKGGKKAIQRDQKLLEQVMNMEPSNAVPGSITSGKRYTLNDLRRDLGDPEKAIQKNMKLFEGKLKVQQNRIEEMVKASVSNEGDRIIKALKEGPHNKVEDPDIRTLWEEMDWRGSVKARYFVMSLRDYYRERRGSGGHAAEGNSGLVVAAKPMVDEWALTFLDVRWLQPIVESFDDDASGYVTIAEANAFAAARPPNWSLPHWIAYWAVGWHQTLTVYVGKIREIFAKMFAILPDIHPSNQATVNKYLKDVYLDITSFTDGVNPCYVNDTLQDKFKDFVRSEEARLRTNLETMCYDIDAMDTLALITGPGRIGKFAHGLLYLLLERHFEIFRLCINTVIEPDELLDAAGSIEQVMKAIWERLGHCESIFIHRRLDPTQQFKMFAHGMFQYLHDPAGLWAPEMVKSKVFPDYPYDDDMKKQDIKVDDILKLSRRPVCQRGLDYDAYESPPSLENNQIFHSADPEVASLANVLGTWNGFMYRKAIPTFPVRGMISMTLEFDFLKGQTLHFRASSRSNLGPFTISGHCNLNAVTNSLTVNMTREFTARQPMQSWKGQMDLATETIAGIWDTELDDEKQRGNFVLKRTAPEDLRFRPSPAAFEADKAGSLWQFAILAVKSQVQRQSWSWSYFKERRKNRQCFVNLYIRRTHYGRPLSVEELVTFREARQSLTSADSRFYHSLADDNVRRTANHGIRCANCRGLIGGPRIICLVCQAKDTWDTVDLCDEPDPLTLEKICVSATVNRDNLPQPHLPSHDVIKVRRIVHIRQFGALIRDSTHALERIRALLGTDSTDGNRTPEMEAEYDSDYSSQALEVVPMLNPALMSGRRPTCSGTECGRIISIPCWYYIHRDADAFICDDCEGKIENIQNPDDKLDLVRCQSLTVPNAKVSLSLMERLENLEKQMDEKLHELDSKMDDRLRRVEELLRSVYGKLKIEEA